MLFVKAFSFIILSILTFLAALKYPGNIFLFVVFSIIFNLFLLNIFLNKKSFFEIIFGFFLWIGYWLKLTIRFAFFEGKFNESVGKFISNAESYDQLLKVCTIGASGVLIIFFLRRKFFSKNLSSLVDINAISFVYTNYRKIILGLTLVSIVIVCWLNFNLQIYQRGLVSQTILPFKLNGVFTWLILFGFSSFVAFFGELELLNKKKESYSILALSLLEGFMTSVSMLSRAMVVNFSSLGLGFLEFIRVYKLKVHKIFIGVSFIGFFLFFLSSVLFVGIARNKFYNDSLQLKKSVNLELESDLFLKSNLRFFYYLRTIMIDRWVGIEGMMAVSSYPKKGWNLWKIAWGEKFRGKGTSFFDREICNSGYNLLNLEGVHFISIPGVMAFLYYPGSYLFLFLGMMIVAAIGLFFEYITSFLVGSILVSSLIAQVVAYRFIHFGYVPARSYLLFGSISLNIFILFIVCVFLRSKIKQQ